MTFSALSFIPAAFIAVNRPVHAFRSQNYSRQHRSSSSRLHNDPSYGLTEDGDFAILGVNAYENDDDDEATGQHVGDISSLLAATTFSGLDGSPTQYSGAQNGNILGLGSTPTSVNNNYAIFGRLDSSSSTNNMIDPKRGSVVGENVGASSQQQQDRYTNHSVDETTLSEIEEWLLSIIPALNEQDAESYSRGLDAIGFNPGCVTMCELQLEDLDFMKVLHRRYLFNEVTGNEHPWEV